MTSETRTLVDVSDISGIELNKCGAKILYPLEKYQIALSQCPNCNDHWFLGNENVPGNLREGKKR